MRLTNPAVPPVVRPVTITFDGQPIEALPGETIAAALSAAGILALRRTDSGAPRGLWCGMGACFDCVVTVDGRIGQRACMTKVVEGLCVESAQSATPAPLAERPQEIAERACDVLVVGAGPAGLTAAIAAQRAGAEVLVLDERDAAGGQYLKPLAPSHETTAPDRQHRLGDALRAEAAELGVPILHGANAWGAFAPDEIAATLGDSALTLRPRRIILAPGGHERPVPVPGWTLPGVMTTGALQTLVRAQRVSPARRVVIAGSGPLNLQLACEALAAGIEVAAVVEAAPAPGFRLWRAVLTMGQVAPDLAWDGFQYLAALKRARVPMLWGSEILACEGTDRFAALRIRTPRGEQRIEAGAAALNMGFQPETGLARALRCTHRFVTDGPGAGLGRLETVTEEDGRTSVPEVFAIGDGAAIGGARVALARGRLAGLAAARDLGFAVPEDSQARIALERAIAFQGALWTIFDAPRIDVAAIADDTIVCRCEEVTAGTLRATQAGGATSLAALKKATRAGMGRCQGRMCGAVVARLCGATDEAGFAAPRAPVKPVAAAALMLELPEWGEAPLVEQPAPIAWRAKPSRGAQDEDCGVLVIGGGVAGLATALYLAREGADVLVADRSGAGMAASTANAGSLHVQLLSYDFGDKAIAGGGPAADTLPLAPRSIALWRELAAGAGEDCGIRTEGGLMLAETEAEMAWLRGKVAMESERGIENHIVGANELRSLAPYLGDHFIGAAFCPAEGQIDPLRGTFAIRMLAARAGARIRENAAITGIERDGTGWRVATEGGVIRAGRIVNAAGPWAGHIARMVGLDLPITGTVQQVIATEPTGTVMRHLVAHAGRHLSLKQGDGGHLLVGGGWPGHADPEDGATRNRRRSIEGNLWIAGRVVPALEGLHAIRAWTGLNVQIDRAPVLGASARVPGFFHTVTSNGMTLGPIAGQMTAEAVLGRNAVPPCFSPDRFG